MASAEREPHPWRERQLRHLRPEITKQLLPLAERLTGHALRILRSDRLPNDVNGMLLPPQQPNRPWEIHFAKGQERFLEHIIAHEVGHIVRLHQVPQEERMMAATTPETRERAARQLAPELVDLLDLGVPVEDLPDLFAGWLSSLASQLTAFPSDLRIERWAFEQFPGLRRVQERSLAADVQRAFPLLDPLVVATTPPTIYYPTMAMNAAQAWEAAALFRRPDLLEPFQERGLVGIGRHLTRLVMEAPDEGHRSDMHAVNRWAEELRLAGWFAWAPYEGSR